MGTVKTSKEFTNRAYMAVFSIILFIIVYLLLLLLSIGLLGACLFIAMQLISVNISFVTIGLGLGLIAVGVFTIVFMIKFLFKKSNTDYSNLTEIDIDREPELQKMIADLVEQTKTKFPKRIYVSPEVNASVFYESSFWSMFLPVRKNLHIGLGLVNTTTVSELKGILAHEFGHFSQRSMKIGSYVHNVNKIIHNILYDNEDYDRKIQEWANSTWYFVLLTGIAVGFNKGVQWVLRVMYKIVNVNHMALSRQMEFHADAIATHIVGSEPMIRSMLRMNLASESYNDVMNFYNAKFSDAYVSLNIFPQQTAALDFIAINNKIKFINGFPDVTAEFSERFNKSKLVISNQWDSHPSEEERIAAYRKLNIAPQNPDNRPANVLFADIESLQCQLTDKIFSGIEFPKERFIADVDAFSAHIKEEYHTNKLPDLFNFYYSRHDIAPFDVDTQIQRCVTLPSLETLFDNDKTELVFAMKAQESDAAALEMIANKTYDTKTFDYDGTRYKAKDAPAVQENLRRKIAENREAVAHNDSAIFNYFYLRAKAANTQDRLVELYKNLFQTDTEYDTRFEIYHQMANDFAFAYETHQMDTIRLKMDKFKKTEQKFKSALQEILSDPFFADAITDDVRKACDDYLNDQFAYFFNDRYNEQEIAIKNDAMHYYAHILGRNYFVKKKSLLDFKASIA